MNSPIPLKKIKKNISQFVVKQSMLPWNIKMDFFFIFMLFKEIEKKTQRRGSK